MTSYLDPPDWLSKADCRRYFKNLRRSLELADLSQRLCDRLSQWSTLQAASTILAYWATPDEVNLSSLISRWPDKTWGLPRTLPQQQMAWHAYRPDDPLQRSKWGIYEPAPNSPSVALESVDVVLVPAIACDCRGMRLGYGAGFYDRCLAQPSLQRALTVGIVPHACWSIAELPCDPWDIPLSAIATEREIWMGESELHRPDT